MAGVFADDQYFDVVVEYAKRSSRDILCRLKIFNRATHDADITVLPQLWFRYVCNLAKCLPLIYSYFFEIEKIQKRLSHKTSSGNLATTWFANILNSVSSVTFVEGSQFLSAALEWYVLGRNIHFRIDDRRRGSSDGRTTPLHRKRD